MKRAFVILLLLVIVWVVGSAVFEWPPLYHYAGDCPNACMNNLQQIDGAKQQWALDTKAAKDAVVDPEVLSKLYFHGHPPVCTSGGTYTYGTVEQNPVCSLATNVPPAPVKDRVGLLGWRWKIWPSPGPEAHRLPPRS